MLTRDAELRAFRHAMRANFLGIRAKRGSGSISSELIQARTPQNKAISSFFCQIEFRR
jgi:hypothetical protein